MAQTSPPLPPTPQEENLPAANTYAATLTLLAARLHGKEKHGTPLFEANTIARYLFTNAAAKKKGESDAVSSDRVDMVGKTQAEKAEVAAWMSMAAKVDDPSYLENDFSSGVALQLNQILETKSFLVGQTLTLADIAVYVAVTLKKDTFSSLLAQPTARWLTTVNEWINANTPSNVAPPGHIPSGCPPPAPKPQPVAQPEKRMGTQAKSAAAPKGKGAAADNAKPSKKEKAKDGEAAAATNQGEGSGEKQQKKKKEKKPKEATTPASSAASDDGPDVCKLDIRVGTIVKAWEHPESDKLWCESIDIGEEKPRSICSGLRPFYATADDLTNRNVLVVANLKARKMAGFTSEGMVLCASSPAHDIVKFVDVPKDAKVGDRVLFEGLPNLPAATPSQITKKKIAETVIFGGMLKTIEEGQCTFEGKHKMIIENCGGCTAPVPAGYTVA